MTLPKISGEAVRIELPKKLLDFVAKAFAAYNLQVDEAMVHKALQPIFGGKEQMMIKTILEEREEILEARGKIELVLTVLRTRFQRIPAEVE